MSSRALLPKEKVRAVDLVVAVGVALRVTGAAGRAEADFPDSQIRSVDVAVFVEIARKLTDEDDLPGRILAARRSPAGPGDFLKTPVGTPAIVMMSNVALYAGTNPLIERDVEAAVERRRARDVQLLELCDRRRPADFEPNRTPRSLREIARDVQAARAPLIVTTPLVLMRRLPSVPEALSVELFLRFSALPVIVPPVTISTGALLTVVGPAALI